MEHKKSITRCAEIKATVVKLGETLRYINPFTANPVKALHFAILV